MCRESLDVPFPFEDKLALYERAGGKCEYPGGCRETTFHKLTIDHFTPVCIGKLLGWTQEQIDHPLNLSLHCRYHHKIKDASTPWRKEVATLQEADDLSIRHELVRGSLRFWTEVPR